MRRTLTLLALVALVATACGAAKDTGFPLETPTPEEMHGEEDTSTREEPAELDGVIVANESNQFVPRYVEVTVGTTVTWEQIGVSPHNVAFDDGTFNSNPDCLTDTAGGCLGDGGTASFTFEESGEYPYYCEIHGRSGGADDLANMAGVIFVA